MHEWAWIVAESQVDAMDLLGRIREANKIGTLPQQKLQVN
jgi:hypothetical protein